MFARRPERTTGGGLEALAAGDAKQGAARFAEHCAVCHGAEGEGGVGAPLAKAWTVDRPAFTVRTTIAHGVPRSAMIAWSQARGGPLTAQAIEDLTAFVLTPATEGTAAMAALTASPAPAITPTPTSTPQPVATATGAPIAATAPLPSATSAPPSAAALPRSAGRLIIGGGLALLLLAGAGLARVQRR